MSTILVVEDDLDVARFIELNLELEGFEVYLCHDGPSALSTIASTLPDLVLTDVTMPGLDGIELVRRLRSDPATSNLPVIMLTARGQSADKVAGLTAGADDYVVKPFDTLELIARVRSTLRRNADMRAVSPLTGLPGNTRIDNELAARIASGSKFALGYLDLDNFKIFNDAYGFLRGDEVIMLLASTLKASAAMDPHAFVGHVGGDDFVLICSPDYVEDICHRVVEIFDTAVVGLHDGVDAERGYLSVVDRQGKVRRFPLVSVSIGIATTGRRTFRDYREVVEVATEMKAVAKGNQGSAIAIDRRSDVRAASR